MNNFCTIDQKIAKASGPKSFKEFDQLERNKKTKFRMEFAALMYFFDDEDTLHKEIRKHLRDGIIFSVQTLVDHHFSDPMMSFFELEVGDFNFKKGDYTFTRIRDSKECFEVGCTLKNCLNQRDMMLNFLNGPNLLVKIKRNAEIIGVATIDFSSGHKPIVRNLLGEKNKELKNYEDILEFLYQRLEELYPNLDFTSRLLVTKLTRRPRLNERHRIQQEERFPDFLDEF